MSGPIISGLVERDCPTASTKRYDVRAPNSGPKLTFVRNLNVKGLKVDNTTMGRQGNEKSTYCLFLKDMSDL